MGKYLFEVEITAVGAGLVPTTRRLGSAFDTSLRQIITDAGGTVDCLYFALGDTDAIVIAELASLATAAAVAAIIVASTHATVRTVALFEPNEIDIELIKGWTWRPPGT
jgi:uncharacterized protein with GYD domain